MNIQIKARRVFDCKLRDKCYYQKIEVFKTYYLSRLLSGFYLYKKTPIEYSRLNNLLRRNERYRDFRAV